MTPKEIIAEIMDRIPCVERPGHNMLAHEIVKKLENHGYVIIPATDWDPAVCRLQFPDGTVPGNAKEAAEGWKQAYDYLWQRLP